MNKMKRLMSLLLTICTVLSLLVVPTYATDQDIDGANGGGGVGGGSGKGTFATSQQGYRMYIIDNNGNLVSNVVDLRFSNPYTTLTYGGTSSYDWYEMYNTKFEKFPETARKSNEVRIIYIEQLTSAGFKSPMYGALKWTGSKFMGQGELLKKWLINGLRMESTIVGGSGGGSGTNYRPSKPTGGGSNKPVSGGNTGNTGGNTGNNGGNTGGNTGTTGGNTSSGSLPSSTYSISSSLQSTMQNIFNSYKAAGIYTKAQATAAAAKEGNARLNKIIASGIYSQDQINYWRNSIAQKIDSFDREYADWEVKAKKPTGGRGGGFGSDPDKVGGFGGNFNSSSASNLIDTPVVTAKNNKSSFLDSIFDVAYAAEGSSNRDGNIYFLLDAIIGDPGERLFKFTNGVTMVKGSTGEESVVETLIANDYRFCIEAIYWFAPARVGDIYRWGKRFYGTVTNYSQLMHYNASKGYWTDDGTGGHMNPTLTKTAATALRPEEKLVRASDDSLLVQEIMSDLTKAKPHKELAVQTMGYDFQWYKGNKPKPDVPETSTYDDVPEKYTYPEYTEYPNGTTPKHIDNKTPHLAVDPAPPEDGGKIKLLPTELQVPGDPRLPDDDPNYKEELEPGYLNTTRTIHIVKCYDIIHLDGTIEHVTTNVRDGEPGKIAIRHEPDYKVVGHFSSADYYGFTIEPITELIEWEQLKVVQPTQISETETTLSEWEYEAVQDKKAGEPVDNSPVRIGVASDLEFNPDKPVDEKHPDGKPDPRYDDTTLYVHLVKKERIPETSTFDEPDNPPSGNPPVVPPHGSEDPFQPNPSDPETDPVEPGNRFAHYRIVKVYETEEQETGNITTDHVFVTFPTNPIVYIQDEAQPGKPDFSYHLIEWTYGDEYDERTLKLDFEPRWVPITAIVNSKGSGTTEAKVNLIDQDDFEKTVTLYVRLRRKVGSRLPGEIIIEQSQISKTIHSNDKNIGGRFGDYSFAMTVGNFKVSHVAYYNHCCVGGDHRYHSCRCLGHTCYHEMPGRAGDNKLNFNFDLISSQHDLEIPKGVFSKTDPKVYGKGGSSFDAITSGVDYPKTISSLYASDNKWYFTSDGNDSNGAEYVPILWRCSKEGLKDIPTLAKFKKNDITKRYSAENYTIPDKMLSSVGSTANKISNKKRASAPMAFAYDFTFGLHSRSDITATSSCVTHNGYNCIDTDTQDYYPIEGTEFTYDFKAQVAIQFYAGTAKGLQAAPFGGKATQPQLEKVIGKHTENNIIQCKQEIKFYPYIRMTYMVNSLDDAIKEEENTYETGYNQDVRKDTYVLSEWESSVLPSDAVTVSWKNKNEDESLLITSQQWSVHQKAVNGSEVWNGKNQVLPGGAIYQLSTPKDNWTTVNITTYQTVVDQKARSEYLSSTLSGDEYTESKVAQDHLDFINDAKEVLDNLKLVQWVNKNPGASKAWTQDFVAKPSQGIVKILDGTSITTVDLSGLRGGSKKNPNDDQKYYMRQQTQLSNYQQVTKLSEWTKTIDDAQSIKEQPYEGDMDVFNMKHETTVYKLFMDTSGDVHLASMTKKYGTNDTGMDNTQSDIENMVKSMKDLNADTYAMGQTGGAKVEKLCNKKVSGSMINSILKDDAKEIDDATSFITNFVSALTRNKGSDYTAEWASDLTDGKWYNEAFDGVYLVKQSTTFNIGLAFSSSRVSALDPALCPQNKGQSDLYTSAFLSQFCLDSQSDATIAQGKVKNFIGTFKGVDITMPDMESMYVSKKFWIPNANVQDLN